MSRSPPPISLDEAAYRAEEGGTSPRAFVEALMRARLLVARNPHKALPELLDLSRARSVRLSAGNVVVVDGFEFRDAKIDWAGFVALMRSIGAPSAERLWVRPPVIITDAMVAAAARPAHLPRLSPGPPPPPRQASRQWWTDTYFESWPSGERGGDPKSGEEPAKPVEGVAEETKPETSSETALEPANPANGNIRSNLPENPRPTPAAALDDDLRTHDVSSWNGF